MTRSNLSGIPRHMALCNTSVADLKSSLYHENDFDTLREAVQYELAHGNRKTVIKLLDAKIKQLEAQLK
jgi:hypothetical protein